MNKPSKCSKCDNAYYCKGVCRPCYMKEYRQIPDQVEKRKKHHKEHYQQCKDVYLRARKKYSEKHKDKRRKNLQEFVKKFRSTERYKEYKKNQDLARLKILRKSTPKWADKQEIVQFYKDRPAGSHVDHIIPLKGKGVCGLHVRWNLQYLPATENLKKGNRY